LVAASSAIGIAGGGVQFAGSRINVTVNHGWAGVGAGGRIIAPTTGGDSPSVGAPRARTTAGPPGRPGRVQAAGPRAEPLEGRRLLSAAGDLDPTFGTGGFWSAAGLGPTLSVTDVTSAPGGKTVVVAAVASGPDGGPGLLTLVRLDAAGRPDPTFGGGDGVTTLPVEEARDVVVFPDGRVAAGSRDAIVRLRADGSPDPAFGGGDGIVARGAFQSGALAVGQDGKLFVGGAGFRQEPDGSFSNLFAVSRLRADGSPDPSFGGGDGVFIGHVGLASDLAVQPDGKVVLAGYAAPNAGSVAVQRVRADGTLDTAFGGGDGFVAVPVGDYAAQSAGIAFDASGRIVVGATALLGDPNGFDPALRTAPFRLRADGSLQTTFQSLPVAGGFGSQRAGGSFVGPDGKVVVVVAGSLASGSFPGPYAGSGTAIRYTPDGKIDASFGGLGYVPVVSGYDGPAVALGSDGKLVAAGNLPDLAAYSGDGGAVQGVGRYLLAADGRPDGNGLTLSADGTLTFTGSAGDDFLEVRGIRDPARGDLVRVTANRTQRVFSRSAIKRVSATLGAGDDRAFVQAFGVNAVLVGGAGNDVLSGGTGADRLDGGPGRDQLDGDGGVGYSGTGAFPAAVPDPTPGAQRSADVLIGGDGDDTLSGGYGYDRLDAGAGTDYLDGGDGNDVLSGGPGDDGLSAGRGDDWVDGGTGADSMSGEAGTDTLYYGDRTAAVFVDQLVDHYQGGEPGERDGATGFEIVVGGSGDDVLRGSEVVGETLLGNGGDDILVGRGGNDTLVGGAGRDRLYGGAGDDLLFGDFQSPGAAGGFGDFIQGNMGFDRARKDPADDVLNIEGFVG
jgi:uncharacterized delta-60 repeat protein